MSSSTKSVTVYDDGIECTPESLCRGIAGCAGFVLLLVVVTSLGVVAGGVFWAAQNMAKLVDDDAATFILIKPAASNPLLVTLP